MAFDGDDGCRTTKPAGRRSVPLEALVDATFVDFPTGWGVRTVVDRAFLAAGLDRRVTIEVADVTTCVELVRAGLGIAVLPPSVLPSGDPELLQRPLSPRITWHVVMATQSSRANAAANALVQLVTEGSPQR